VANAAKSASRRSLGCFARSGRREEVLILFPVLTGLAVGLALKELRYTENDRDSPLSLRTVGSPDLRFVSEDSAKGRETLANMSGGYGNANIPA
jgi:hypothetical protein